MTWRCTGVGWPAEARIAVLRWEGGRISPLTPGKRLGFRADGERVCVGARGNPCPLRAGVPGRAARALCRECAALDRVGSVAADGVPDDPRTYRVYLAWFGPGMVKVGITAEERGPARLLEQGAVVFSWLGRGPLMAARRTEEVLRSALGVPDRIAYAEKRAVRPLLAADPAERAAEVEELHRRALGVGGWTETLHPLPYEPSDHAGAFGLDRLAPTAPVVRQLVDGGAVAGTLVAVAGPDLHLGIGEGRQVVLDTRLLAGWSLVGADPASGVSVPLADAAARSGGTQDGLF
ncbi:DUF2797 domain-containing protein [Streptomyces sp. NPDC094448]|uniref:DUF2797 domain-containing protein n=1 Tax=Streptomyces sp. NPDC094448 TaxID=3366063 RepID=UPI00380E37B6